MKLKIFSLLIFSFFFMSFSNFLSAQSADKDKQLTDFIERVRSELEMIPAISVAVSHLDDKKNTQPFAYTTGYTNIETKQKATNSTGFYIASSTKSFVGLLACILEYEGKMDLKKPIIDYKPFSNFKEKAKFEGITINDLLSHQVGVDNEYLSSRLAYTGEYTEEEILKITEQESEALETGKQFMYSNYGYYLFSMILKAELGENWQDLLQEKIFTPLEMKNSSAKVSDFDENELAKPHHSTFGKDVQKSDFFKIDETMHAAGGVITSAEDMANFLSFLLNDGNFKGKIIYPKAVLEKNQEKLVSATHDYIKIFEGNGYARGWRIGDFEGKKVIYHFGGYHGFASHVSFLPNEKIGVSVVINHSLGLDIGNLIAKYAYYLYLGDESAVKKLEKKSIKKLQKKFKRYNKSEVKYAEKLAKREWMLSLPKEQYIGSYKSKNIGTVNVSYQDGKLLFTTGNVKSIATAYELEECMRIELAPGNGIVIRFQIEDGKPVSFSFGEDVFEKI
ncbi:serine hydrolase domain-containing protein [Bernardetia sp. OM2101]|uniref:serine hydrolase domain-containing protein n=1 Tax=Bernardetia sp. OM2101 TaxID=3344876 RepID=UPI0035CEDFC0